MPFRPFSDAPRSLRQLQDEINHVVERVWEGAPDVLSMQPRTPKIDVYELPERYVIHAEIAGLSGDDVEVAFLDNVLTLRGERCVPIEETDEVRVVRRERRFGKFSRHIELPGEVDADGIKAKCRAGVLEITVPRVVAESPKTVKVTEG